MAEPNFMTVSDMVHEAKTRHRIEVSPPDYVERSWTFCCST
jgi:hypothetical protein